jgi:iron(III) transport system ATP-binding protein
MLRVVGLDKTYADGSRSETRALRGLSLDVPAGRIFTILGPSGCGKTTLLRCVAGLETPEAGEIAVADRVLFSAPRRIDVRADERGVGMVFQSYAIWPHMTVFENAAFPLRVLPRRRRPTRRAIRERVERVLSAVRLEGLAARPATDLSGGQQQRLALARALVPEPPLLLLDEPLSNLDAKLREEMRFELKRLQAALGVTTVYVTHDQVEALAISDVVAVMRDGALEQVGAPRDVYERPASSFVADFIGASNLIDGTLVAADGGVWSIETSEGTLRATAAAQGVEPGATVVVVLRAEQIALGEAAAPANGHNRLLGVVRAHAFLGGVVDHVVSVGELELRVRSEASRLVAPGTAVALTFSPEAGSVVPTSR